MHDEHEPLSWLTLERYTLGELSAGERAQVEARLAQSEADRACLAQILADQSELPPLPQTAGTLVALQPARGRRARWALLAAGVAAAAALLLLRMPQREVESGDGVKGNEVVLRLISEQQGRDPHSFATGERFKVELTCAPALAHSLRLLVFQDGELFEPLPTAELQCGNRVTWPGAFALDGSAPALVCLYWGAQQSPSQHALGSDAVCSELKPR